MKKTSRYLLFLMLVVILHACKDDKKGNPGPAEGFIAKGKGVFITCEGNFQFGNATVGFYNREKDEVSNDVFKAVNSRPLGDVCQSMLVDDDRAYIVVNNSSKIEVVTLPDFNSAGTITGLSSPRYIMKVSPTKAYVTNYYSNSISIIDLSTHAVSGQIPCYGWTEQMLMLNGKVYVVNVKSEKLYVINPQTDAITDSIPLGALAVTITVDKNQDLWLGCKGDKSKSIKPSVKRVDPVSRTVEQSYELSDPESTPGSLCTNAAGDTVYFTFKGVYKMAVQSATLPAMPWLEQGTKVFYGLGIDPVTGDTYVADAIDYVQKGKVYRYSKGGQVLGTFSSGIIPGGFYFY